ncbi:hypothetical protein Vadar_016854 [Vaccinium darrowii]|uniref:Uncharacterized protein n=1 Tax=Vaccinium darrowii TaxID=229202 RepID=A0ACB7XR71_9ERIC|nr:hypothetical protein Vadar_016854 [Vaccinium darrowii]
MMQSPNPSAHFACKVCDKVFVGAHEMVRHFQLAHMRDNEIIYEDLNPKPYPNYQDQVFSHQNPIPSATHSGFQSIQRYSSVEQNPSTITSQVPSSHGARISSHQVSPYTPPSFKELLLASVQPVPKPTPPPLAHTPISDGCSFQSPPNLAPPLLPFVVLNQKFVKKPSVQEVEHIFEGGSSTHNCTKPLIDKLDIPIPDGIEGLESNEVNAGNGVNPKIDLTLKL